MEEKKRTGYPSIDKPWLKYYTEEQIKAPLPHMTAYEYLRTQNAQRLDYIAIDSEVGKFTYRELFAMIDATANALWAMGIQKGKNVLSMFPVLPHESFLFYGIDAVGAALCQVAPQYTAVEICNFADRIEADLFFTFDPFLTPEMEQMIYENTNVRHIVAVSFTPLQGRDARTLAWDAFMAMGQGVTLPEIRRDPTRDVLFLAGTGGSTGEPKLVMLSDDCVNISVHQYICCDLDYRPGDVWMRVMPTFPASGMIANHHLPLCIGMKVVTRNFPSDTTDLFRLILRHKPQHMMMFAPLFDVMEQSEVMKDQDLSFIRTLGCGGMGITHQFEERVKDFFQKHNVDTFLGYGWGSTESSACAANRTSKATAAMGTAGAPMARNVISAFDPDTGIELKYGEEGELCICSPNLMLGYYKNPKLSETTLRRHADGSLWLHTGDLGMVTEDGLIIVNGRMVRVIFVHTGAKVYPKALEDAVSQIDGVQTVAFCEIPDTDYEGFFAPVCFVVPDSTHDADAVQRSVAQYCQEALPEHARPKYIFIRDELPLTRVGKPDILALEKEAAQIVGA